MDGWTRAWPEKDADLAASLYADDALYLPQPLGPPYRGPVGAREFASQAFAAEEVPTRLWFGEPLISGSRASVEYWAVVTRDGNEFTIAGVAVIRFQLDGRVADERNYSAVGEGGRAPAADWFQESGAHTREP
jgi:ketosteroid isomerase-like protein